MCVSNAAFGLESCVSFSSIKRVGFAVWKWRAGEASATLPQRAYSSLGCLAIIRGSHIKNETRHIWSIVSVLKHAGAGDGAGRI